MALVGLLGNLVRNTIWLDRIDEARAYLAEVLPLTRESGDERGLMFILRQAGNFAVHNPVEAAPLFEESLALARKLGDRAGESSVLNSIGNMHQHQGDWAAARASYETGLTAVAAAGNPYVEEMLRENLGVNFAWEGRYDEAQTLLDEALQMARKLGLVLDEASTTENIVFLELRRGNLEAAAARLKHALGLYRSQSVVQPATLVLAAILEAHRGDRRRAQSWAGLALSRGSTSQRQMRNLLDLFDSVLRGDLTAAEIAAARTEGESLDLASVLIAVEKEL